MKILLLLVVLLASLVQAKIYAPYCRSRPQNVRYCRNDDSCRYADEQCNRGQCQIIRRLYNNNPCRNFDDNGQSGLCAATLCPRGTYCRDGACYRR
ncbi:UNKNOWN [Stylonychia lemnae]|uniref:Dickkopf N-terminal cysteine-rich domain-containing protein n=1 Tax=Stylonychia lemnae TaxID=5949 RepID=A0A078A846_STYLE|nr:UNKNOWN [Stylonychia lemnae]|eukprot:CDW78041.1 UNKNOWN [Stylonychia lemnae]